MNFPTLYIGRVYFWFEACLAMRFSYSYRKMVELFANSGDPDQTPHFAAFDLGLHCFPVTLLGFSRPQWVKKMYVLGSLEISYLDEPHSNFT